MVKDGVSFLDVFLLQPAIQFALCMKMTRKFNLLGLICLVSLVFLVMQIAIHGSFSNWNVTIPIKAIRMLGQVKMQKDPKEMWNAVQDYTEVCKELRVTCVLVDQVILKHLAERLVSYSKDATLREDGHKKCHYFCNSNVITFVMLASNVVEGKKIDPMLDALGKKNFQISILRSTDDRVQSLESNIDKKDIKTHLILKRGKIFIHVVLLYERQEHLWSAKCSLSAPNRRSQFPEALRSGRFCKNENILSSLTWTETQMDKLSVTIPKHPVSFIPVLSSSKFLPCDMKRARAFYSKYGVLRSTEADLFRLKAKNLLFTVKFVLDRLGVRFWLSSGTCLGWFRQCDFIPHSKDLDIGIWIKDYNDKISEKLQKAGLVPKHVFGKVEDSFELSFRTLSNDIKLDIFFFYEEDDHMWNGGTQAKTGKKFKYRFPKFEICWTEFAGLIVRVPCSTLAYIEANYGASWNLQIKEWDWKKSPANVKENGVWPEKELSKVVQVFQ